MRPPFDPARYPTLARIWEHQHAIATCERCGRPIRVGRAYVRGSAPGRFVHRGPCVLVPKETS
jgi:hypothetical protein